MDMSDLVGSMRARMPWLVGQRVLREIGLPRGHGWDKTFERLTDPGVDYADKRDRCTSGRTEGASSVRRKACPLL